MKIPTTKLKRLIFEGWIYCCMALIIGLAGFSVYMAALGIYRNTRGSQTRFPLHSDQVEKASVTSDGTSWQSAAWIYQPDGSRVQFGLRADGTVVWRKLQEESP